MALTKWKQTFSRDGCAYKNGLVYVYLAGTTTPARIFDENSKLLDTAPQTYTDGTGKVIFSIDSDDYPSGQLFDITCKSGECYEKNNIEFKNMMLLQDTEGGRNFKQTFAQNTAPDEDDDNLKAGDIWFDTDNENHLYRWNGTAFVDVKDGSIATAATTANWSQVVDDAPAITPKPEDGATVGADWTTNLDNIPAFGDLSLLDVVEAAKLGTTVVDGGYIKTSLLDVDNIIATGSILVTDGDISGTKIGATSLISGGYIRTTFLDVSGIITAGSILVTGDADKTATIIQAGLITTGSIQSSDYDTSNGMKIDLTNSQIIVREESGFLIDAAGGLKVEAAADISLISDYANASNPALIKWYRDTQLIASFGASYNSQTLNLYPRADNSNALKIGYNPDNSAVRFSSIYLNAYSTIDLIAATNITINAPYLRGSGYPNIGSSTTAYKFGYGYFVYDLSCRDISCDDISCGDVTCGDVTCDNILFNSGTNSIGSSGTPVDYLYVGTRFELRFGTYVAFLGSGTGGTEDGYIQISLGGSTRYIRLHTTA